MVSFRTAVGILGVCRTTEPSTKDLKCWLTCSC